MHCVGVCAMAGHGQFLQCNLFFWLKIIYIYTLLGQVSWNTEDLQHHIIISKHVTYQNIKKSDHEGNNHIHLQGSLLPEQ